MYAHIILIIARDIVCCVTLVAEDGITEMAAGHISVSKSFSPANGSRDLKFVVQRISGMMRQRLGNFPPYWKVKH